MRIALFVLTVLLSCGAVFAAEEATTGGPPPVIAVGREEIPPGRMPAHERNAAGFVSVLNRISSPSHRIALVPISGDDNHVLYIEGYGSFAELEQARGHLDQAVASNAALRTEMDQLQRDNAQLHNSQKTMLARYRADLSYRPHPADEIARARFVSITVARVKPGRGPDYAALLKEINAARVKGNIDAHFAVYQIATGGPFGTFLFFSTHRGLKEWDDGFARADQDQKAVDDALGGAVVAQNRRALFADVLAEGTNTLYAINPAMSRPTAQMAAVDPDFWTPKPVVATGKALAAKKVSSSEKP